MAAATSTDQGQFTTLWLDTNATKTIFATLAEQPALLNVRVKKGEVVIIMYDDVSAAAEKHKCHIKENDSIFVGSKHIKVWNAAKDQSCIEFSLA